MKRARASDDAAWRALVTDARAREAALEEARKTTVVAASAADAKGERELLLARAFAHPRDARIRFVEASHSYFLDDQKVKLSVSGLWGRYFSHFDSAGALRGMEKWRTNEHSPYYGLLRHLDLSGVPRDQQGDVIRRTWTANGLAASGAGTLLHRQIELCLNEETHGGDEPPAVGQEAWRGRKDSPFYNLLMYLDLVERATPEARGALALAAAPPGTAAEEVDALFERLPTPSANAEFAQWRAWREAHPELLPVRTEMNVYADELCLAGQIDALFYDERAAHFVMVDWKRVVAMERQAFNDRRGKPPFQHLPDTNLFHYAVQQNLYAGLLRHWYGVRPERLLLLQLHPNLDVYVEHELPALDAEVDEVFAARAREVGSDWAP